MAEILSLAPHLATKPCALRLKRIAWTMPLVNSMLGVLPIESVEFDVSIPNVEDAEEVLHVEEDLLCSVESKEKSEKSLLKSMSEKIIGFKFGMDDHQVDSREASKNVEAAAEELKQIDIRIDKIKATLSF